MWTRIGFLRKAENYDTKKRKKKLNSTTSSSSDIKGFLFLVSISYLTIPRNKKKKKISNKNE